MSKDYAYHFVGKSLRDGTPVPANGVLLKHSGKLQLCNSGFHASYKVWQALNYAPGNTLCRVHCGGDLIEREDKLVCTERTIIARIDAEALLFDFARSCARDVLHLWDAPPVVVKFLETGDENSRYAASAAAEVTAWDAARLSARYAARGAAWATARDAKLEKQQRARLTRMVNAAFEAAS